MSPEQFEATLRVYVKERDASLSRPDHLDRCEAKESAEYVKDKLLAAYRAAWENRVPEEATLISCPGSRGGIVLLYVQNAQWIVCSRGKNYAAAPTPALALEAWRRAGERSEG